MTMLSMRSAVATGTLAAAIVVFGSETLITDWTKPGPSEAQAVIGRPLTPLSYAGVARRTVRRSEYGIGALGTVGVAPAARCVRAVTPYGRVILRC